MIWWMAACARTSAPVEPGPGSGRENVAACIAYVRVFNEAPCMHIDLDVEDLCPRTLDESPIDLGCYYRCMTEAVRCTGERMDLSGQAACQPDCANPASAPAPQPAGGGANTAACVRYVEAFNHAECNTVALAVGELCPAALDLAPCDLAPYYDCMAAAVGCRGDLLDLSGQASCALPSCG
jgi:hypothetical protein